MAAMPPPTRGFAVAALAAAAFVLLPGVAAADVTVAASRAESGARDVTITFRVTNDDPAVPTTRLEVFLPTARPLLGVVPVAPDGWTAQVGTAVPTTPVTVDGAPVPEIATSVAWKGGPLLGDGYAVFPVDVDRLPDGAGPLRFRVVQTNALGGTVEWSDLVPYGAPAPEHPSLVVPYSDTPAAPAAAENGHHHGAPVLDVAAGTGSPWWTAGLGAVVVAAVTAATVVLGRRQRRRFSDHCMSDDQHRSGAR
jgi:periplasmic copper chaperone A